MIIKEFRIVIPVSVEEYQIAQLYTIQKKSRLESVGAGSGVEIIENRPYQSEKEKGQYTLKVYHVDERLPPGIKTLSKLLFPKSALLFEEESWNCYPYTRTKYRHKMFKGFNIDIESKYLPDYGLSNNVFNLSKSELHQRSIEYIDIVNDTINEAEYKAEEDPLLFVSKKTDRGPLPTTWLDELKQNANTKNATTIVGGKPIQYMCSYKLCRIECAIWGCQSRLEKSISESVLRHMILTSHRQAWCWQDEYVDLSMDDVRQLEAETQAYLMAKMRHDTASIDKLDAKFEQQQQQHRRTSRGSKDGLSIISKSIQSMHNNNSDAVSASSKLRGLSSRNGSIIETNESILKSVIEYSTTAASDYEDFPSNEDDERDEDEVYEEGIESLVKHSSGKFQVTHVSKKSVLGYSDHTDKNNNEFTDLYHAQDDDEDDDGMDKISHNSSRLDEFYDAISQVSFTLSTNLNELESQSTTSLNFESSSPSKVIQYQQQQHYHHNHSQPHPHLLMHGTKAPRVHLTNKHRKHRQEATTSPKKRRSLKTRRNNKVAVATDNNSDGEELDSDGDETVVNTHPTVVLKRRDLLKSATLSALETTKLSIDLTTARSVSPGVHNIPVANEETMNSKVSFNLSQHQHQHQSAHKSTSNNRGMNRLQSIQSSASSTGVETLIIVVHGGNVTCTDTSKQSDFTNFKTTMETVIKTNHGNYTSRVAYRLVTCEPICKDALIKLATLSPVANQHAFAWNETDDLAEVSAEVFTLHENLPFNTLPLLALANQTQYRASVVAFVRECNRVYREFLASADGANFQGTVCIVGDSLGSLLVYDALCQQSTNTTSSNSGDDTSSLNQSSIASSSNSTAAGPIPNKLPQTLASNYKHSSSSPSPNNLNKPQISINDLNVNENDPLVGTTMNTGAAGLLLSNSLDTRHLKRNSSNSSAFDFSVPYLTPAQQHSPTLNSGPNSAPVILTTTNQYFNSVSMLYGEERLDFDVSHFFVFGSPLGLVLAYKKLSNNFVEAPCCTQVYNLFHLTDPIAVRVEPLLCKQFRFIEPCMIPRYTKFPLGDGANLSLDHFIVKYGNLFETNTLLMPANSNSNNESGGHVNRNLGGDYSLLGVNEATTAYLTPNFDQLKSLQKIMHTKSNWWGESRIDYVLYAPEKIANLPKKSLPYIFHSCYWESTDVAAFIVRMAFKADSHHDGGRASMAASAGEPSLANNYAKEPIEKWQRRLNRVKLRNLSSNHRANDVIVLEDREQVLGAKFSYGPLDFALCGERVDIFITNKPFLSSSNNSSTNQLTTTDWRFYSSEITDNHGKLKYVLPKDKRLSLGMYMVRMIVKCDHTVVEFNLTVLPANTEAVVFSIDGSFAANISFSGTDPKVRAGAVDVVRHWQDLGYLIIYITARPDIQHYKVTNWLAQHNFPLGMVYFSDGLSRDPIRQKTETLRHIVLTNSLKLNGAYGSAKDIPMYASLGLPPNRIFMIGKLKEKYVGKAVVLKDGYATHLSMLQNPNSGFRHATGNARLFIKKTTFTVVRQNALFSSTLNLSDPVPSIAGSADSARET